MDHNNLYHRGSKTLLNKAGLPGFTFHSLPAHVRPATAQRER
jgi:hypothetical protein